MGYVNNLLAGFYEALENGYPYKMQLNGFQTSIQLLYR